jgi:hypothetical protein
MNFTRYIIKFIKNIPHTYGNMRYHIIRFLHQTEENTRKNGLKYPVQKHAYESSGCDAFPATRIVMPAT